MYSIFSVTTQCEQFFHEDKTVQHQTLEFYRNINYNTQKFDFKKILKTRMRPIIICFEERRHGLFWKLDELLFVLE